MKKFVFNTETIYENVRKILFDFDIKDILLYENQEGYWRDLENIDSFWRSPTSPESPDLTNQPNSPLPDSTPTPSIPEVAKVSIIDSSRLETPPVSLCQRNENLISTSKFQSKTLFLLFLRSRVDITLLVSFVPCYTALHFFLLFISTHTVPLKIFASTAFFYLYPVNRMHILLNIQYRDRNHVNLRRRHTNFFLNTN